MKKDNFIKGRKGENIAKNFLLAKGFNWIESNYSNVFGEVDLVMIDKDSLVFVEVKMKNGDNFGNPEEMITKGKIRQVKRVATSYMVLRPEVTNNFEKFRIDAVCIACRDDGDVSRINHYENIYE